MIFSSKTFLAIFLLISSLCEAALPSLDQLTIEEKVGQILMVHFHGEEANLNAEILIRKAYIGSFILYNWSNGLHNRDQVKKMCEGLNGIALSNAHKIPLFISVDQEGGAVNRLNRGFTHFPSNSVVGATGDYSNAYQIAFTVGQELLSVGINMNLAPVADVRNTHDTESTLASRTFGDDPEQVSLFVQAALKGYKNAHILSVMKHFPGHGDVREDSHFELPILNKSLIDLEMRDIYPFNKLHSMADAIMAGHILVPILDEENCASLSFKILEDYLRKKIGYQGLIISDSLVMQGVLKNGRTVDEVAILSFNAGCDLLILGGGLLKEKGIHELTVEDVLRIHANLVSAVKSGKVSVERLDEAVMRVLNLKANYCP